MIDISISFYASSLSPFSLFFLLHPPQLTLVPPLRRPSSRSGTCRDATKPTKPILASLLVEDFTRATWKAGPAPDSPVSIRWKSGGRDIIAALRHAIRMGRFRHRSRNTTNDLHWTPRRPRRVT